MSVHRTQAGLSEVETLAEESSEGQLLEYASPERIPPGSTGQASLGIELARLRQILQTQFELANWIRVAKVLDLLMKLGQEQGQRDLCLRAQSLRQALGERRLEHAQDIYRQLLARLNHLEWRYQSRF